MGATSGLTMLARAVGAYFEDNNVEALVLFGLQARGRWAKPRVVIIPGFYDGSEAPRPMPGGAFGPPTKKESFNPRELAEWTRAVTLSIFAVDQTAPNDEILQTEALDDLTESTIQAVWNGIDPVSGKKPGGAGTEWGDSVLMHPPVQFGYGKELLLHCTVKMPFYDLEQAIRHPSVGPLTKKFAAPLHP